MLLRKVTVENVRSFLSRAELNLEGSISILIGPNGGGKTNPLDIVVVLLRRYLFASKYPVHTGTAEQPGRHEFRDNDALNNMMLERHSNGVGKPQFVEVEIEVTQRDIDNMCAMQKESEELSAKAETKYVNVSIKRASTWTLENFTPGLRLNYKWNGNAVEPSTPPAAQFREYLNNFEIDSFLRAEFEVAALSTPMLYLPVSRAVNAFQASVELAGYNDFEQKRQLDASISRSGHPPRFVPCFSWVTTLATDCVIAGRSHHDCRRGQLVPLQRYSRASPAPIKVWPTSRFATVKTPHDRP